MEGAINLTEIAIVVLVALVSGLLLARFKQPPILGYIATGIALGPSGFSVIRSRDQLDVLAELGVLLLLFVVGMELSLRSFKNVWIKATVCAIAQILIGIGVTCSLSYFFHWPLPFALLLGFVVSLSSTAVVVKMMESIGEAKSDLGQLAIGILIAQDLAIVPMILILKNCNTGSFGITLFIKLFLSIGLIVALISYLSRRQRVRLPLTKMIAGEKDLTPLASLTFCFSAAAISGLAGLSAPYGAFLAGLFLGNTHERLIMIESTHPIQSILMMAFFLFIGLLLDVRFILDNLWSVCILLLIITIGKTALNIALLRFCGLSWSKSFLLSAVLAQLGEFSFLMSTVSFEAKIINETGQKLIVGLTVLSLAFSPIWMITARRLKSLIGQVNLGFLNVFCRVYKNEVTCVSNLCQKIFEKDKKAIKQITFIKADDDQEIK
jgi:CPA2 family monovalent cation:H+ antiporter-2